jgi:hypothetical protein
MTLYFADDWNPIICPSCDKEVARDYCPRCEHNVSEQPPMMTLDEWRALNPEIVAAERARLLGLPRADELSDPLPHVEPKRRAA